LRNEGKSFAEIARELNRAKISPPKGPIWNVSTLEEILKNRAYIGEKINGKYEIDLKTKRSKRVSPDKWIVKENRLPPIISREISVVFQNSLCQYFKKNILPVCRRRRPSL
jgi:hypothetical protein